MTRELLAGVFLSATGTGAGTLLVMHGGKILVRRVALRTFQKVVAILAGRITQQVIKSAVGKWLPVVGAAVIAAWSNLSTRSIGHKAIEILQKDIELSDEIIDADVIQSTIQEQSQPVQATPAPVEEEKKTTKAIPAKVKAAQKKPGVKTAQRKSPGRGGKQVSNTRRAVKSQKPKRISKSKPKAIGRRKAPSR